MLKRIFGAVFMTTRNERLWFKQDIRTDEGNEFTADVLAGDHAEAERFVADVTRSVNFEPVRDMRKISHAADYYGYND